MQVFPPFDTSCCIGPNQGYRPNFLYRNKKSSTVVCRAWGRV